MTFESIWCFMYPYFSLIKTLPPSTIDLTLHHLLQPSLSMAMLNTKLKISWIIELDIAARNSLSSGQDTPNMMQLGNQRTTYRMLRTLSKIT